jgi:processive 1,2-diacylglycerol beta-glucosyltransferase
LNHDFYDKKKLSPEHIIVLLTGMKKKFSQEMLLALVRESAVKNITILQGRNKRLFSALKSSVDHPKCQFLEFINLKDVMKDHDIIIAKPGGALMSECIAQDVLLIAPCFMPGQEEGNIAFMKKARVGVYEEDPEAIISLITSPSLSKYCDYFKKIKNSHAIRDIINEVEKIGR